MARGFPPKRTWVKTSTVAKERVVLMVGDRDRRVSFVTRHIWTGSHRGEGQGADLSETSRA